MATIQKRNDSYKITVSCGYTLDGRQIRKTMTYKPTAGMTERQIEKELQRQVVNFEEKCRQGYSSEKLTFSEFAERWLNLNEARLAPITLSRYRELLKLINKHIGHIRLEKLTPLDIVDFLKLLPTLNYAPVTQRHYYRVIHIVLSNAYKLQLINKNVATLVSPPKVPKKEVLCLDDNEAKHFLECLVSEKDIRIKIIFLLLLYGGFRIGELLGLEWCDINFDKNTITIARTSQYLERKVITKLPKNDSSIRTITLPPEIFDVLIEYKKWWLELKELVGFELDRLFITKDGKQIIRSTVSKYLNSFTKKHNLPKITLHSLRHSHATLLIASGIPIKTVSNRLGHNDTSTTANIYAHCIKSMDVAASEKLSEILPF